MTNPPPTTKTLPPRTPPPPFWLYTLRIDTILGHSTLLYYTILYQSPSTAHPSYPTKNPFTIFRNHLLNTLHALPLRSSGR